MHSKVVEARLMEYGIKKKKRLKERIKSEKKLITFKPLIYK